jgi:adenylate cyclase, class 2
VKHLNVEMKARCQDLGQARQLLLAHGANFVGTDHQVDTYFYTPTGRLKLREGQIERSLIHYDREDLAGIKKSEVSLYHPQGETAPLKQLLAAALGTWATVDKQREIYFIGNVKFHLDRVAGLGEFVEIEAIDRDGSLGEAKLFAQCNHFMSLLRIGEDAMLAESYSDLLSPNPMESYSNK